MAHRSKIFIIIALVFFVGCDRVTKIIADAHLKDSATKTFLAETVRLQYAENEGAFLGIGSTLPKWIRMGASWMMLVIALGAFMLLLAKASALPATQTAAFILMLAGGFGNLYDRLCNDGRVVDFLLIVAGPFRTGIFNVADLCITCGVMLIAIDTVRSWKEHREQDVP